MRSPFLKVSASLVKPTRETLVDYSSYCLLVIGLIGVARVWIGGTGLRNGCPPKGFTFPEKFPASDNFEIPSGFHDSLEHTPTLVLTTVKESEHYEETAVDDFYQPATSLLETESKGQSATKRPVKEKAAYPNVGTGTSKHVGGANSTKQQKKCVKQYQSVFAYILLIESAILLFLGLIWAKVPKVSCIINEFSELTHSCEKSEWADRALHLINEKGQPQNISQSLYSVISNDSAIYDIKSLLDAIFHPDGDYKTKACARHLYEKVQIFCDTHTRRTSIWTTYVIKSFLQFGLWIIIFNINLVLFVVLEFYAFCPEDSPIPCDHDMFLRIVWFMAQTLLLIYAVFICKTLRWINEKLIVRRWPCCSYFNCIRKHRTLYTTDNDASLSCKPYRFADNEPVYNDIALLLHLLEEAHPKVLPYFVVFMFPEWKEKLTSFANPIHVYDVPIRSAMQMLSGRPPPIIEITDIPLSDHEEESENSSARNISKKKSKNSVTFFVGNEFRDKDDRTEKELAVRPANQSTETGICISPKIKKKGASLSKNSWSSGRIRSQLINGSNSRAIEDAGETTALVHVSSSSDSIKSSDHDSDGVESRPSSDMSESPLLLYIA